MKAATHETPVTTNKELHELFKNQHRERATLSGWPWGIYNHSFRTKDISEWLQNAAGEIHLATDLATLQIEYHTRFPTLPDLEPWAWAEYMVRTGQQRYHMGSAGYFTEYPNSEHLNQRAQSMRIEGRNLTRFPAVRALGKIYLQTIKETPAVLEMLS